MKKQQKKLGRPSKADILAREEEKINEENKLKEKLLSTVENLEYPLFKYNETVKRVSSLVITDYNPSGTVLRQDIGSRFVFVAWYDGTKCWIDSRGLVRVDTTTKKKRRGRKKKEEKNNDGKQSTT